MSKPIYTAITDILTTDYVLASVANTPLNQLATMVQNTINYLNVSTTLGAYGITDANLFQVTDGLTTLSIGTGNGTLTSWALPVGWLSGAAVYKDDWQGNELQYPTPRTNLSLHSEDFSQTSYRAMSSGITTAAATSIAPSGATLKYTFSASWFVNSTALGITGTETLTFSSIFEIITSIDTHLSIYDETTSTTLEQIQLVPSTGVVTGTIGTPTFTVVNLGTGPNGGTLFRLSISAGGLNTTHAYHGFWSQNSASTIIIHAEQTEVGIISTSSIQTTTAPVTVTDYSLSGNQITFASAPANSAVLTAQVGRSAVANGPFLNGVLAVDKYSRALIDFSQPGHVGLGSAGQFLGVASGNLAWQLPPVTSVFGRPGAVVAVAGDYTLAQLGGVVFTSLTAGQVLEYNGTNWVNSSLASALGKVVYVGTWNASTNTPTLPSASSATGDYYIVSTAGTYNSIGFQVGDWVISDGTNWDRVDAGAIEYGQVAANNTWSGTNTWTGAVTFSGTASTLVLFNTASGDYDQLRMGTLAGGAATAANPVFTWNLPVSSPTTFYLDTYDNTHETHALTINYNGNAPSIATLNNILDNGAGVSTWFGNQTITCAQSGSANSSSQLILQSWDGSAGHTGSLYLGSGGGFYINADSGAQTIYLVFPGKIPYYALSSDAFTFVGHSSGAAASSIVLQFNAWTGSAGTSNNIYTDYGGVFHTRNNSNADILTLTQTGVLTVATVNQTWVAKTAAYTASVGDNLIADTSGGAFTITLPASPAIGNMVKIADGGGTFGADNLTIAGNGSNIMGSSANLIMDTNYAAAYLLYYNSTRGWILVQP